MEHQYFLKVASNHRRILRSQFRIICSILLWQCGKGSVHQMECHSSTRLWSSVMHRYLNERLHNIQVCVWSRNRYSSTPVCYLHVWMHSQWESSNYPNQIANLLVFWLPHHMRSGLGFSLHPPLENSSLSNLHPGSLRSMGTHEIRKIKSKILMGSQKNIIGQWIARFHDRPKQ